MRGRPGTVVARRAARSARAPIGFEVRDATGRGGAYAIDEGAGEAIVFGSAGAVPIRDAGVLPAHFVVLPHDGMLVAASASAAEPAMLNGLPLPTSWTVIEIPSRIRMGAAAVDFFVLRPSRPAVVAPDAETTVAIDDLRFHAPVPRGSLASHVRMHWRNATMSTRVLLGVVAILLVFLFARSSTPPHATGDLSERADQAATADDHEATIDTTARPSRPAAH